MIFMIYLLDNIFLHWRRTCPGRKAQDPAGSAINWPAGFVIQDSHLRIWIRIRKKYLRIHNTVPEFRITKKFTASFIPPPYLSRTLLKRRIRVWHFFLCMRGLSFEENVKKTKNGKTELGYLFRTVWKNAAFWTQYLGPKLPTWLLSPA
jgi:hypothetical protein